MGRMRAGCPVTRTGVDEGRTTPHRQASLHRRGRPFAPLFRSPCPRGGLHLCPMGYVGVALWKGLGQILIIIGLTWVQQASSCLAMPAGGEGPTLLYQIHAFEMHGGPNEGSSSHCSGQHMPLPVCLSFSTTWKASRK